MIAEWVYSRFAGKTEQVLDSGVPTPEIDHKEWYQRSLVITLLLFFCCPAGIFLMWKYARWGRIQKMIETAAGILISLCLLLSCYARVPAPLRGLEIGQDTILLEYGEYCALDICVYPLEAEGQRLEYLVGDEQVLKVEDGVVVPLTVGRTTVSVTNRTGEIVSPPVPVIIVPRGDRVYQQAAERIIQEINRIGNVTPEKAGQVQQVRETYNQADARVKAYVTNLGMLESAEKQLAPVSP